MKQKKEQSEYHKIELTSQKNIIWRRMAYSLFVIFFLIITPVIILYTQGYRYNFKRGQVQKTGIMIISSIPKKADVHLNNNLITGDPTPTRIEKLSPAEYDIKLVKDGYHNWQKKLQVEANSTTFAEDVILWKQSLPIQLANYDISDWTSTADRKKIAIISENKKIIYFSLGDNQFEEIYQSNLEDTVELIDWSNTGKKILAKTGNSHIVINTERNNTSPFIIADKKYKSVKWDTKNDNLLYGLNNSGVWQIDIFKNEETLILERPVSDFIVNDNTIYSLYKNIVYINTVSDKTEPEILDSARCNDCKFINKGFNKLILLDKITQSLFVIDPTGRDKTITQSAKAISWLNDDTLLFYNDWEIWLLEKDKTEPELVTRIGSGIDNAIWHNNGRHIIFTSDDEIKIIELDNRELRNIVQLFAGDNIKYLSLDSKGKNIYFESIIAKKESVMELNIQ
jgi:hypothetical protein